MKVISAIILLCFFGSLAGVLVKVAELPLWTTIPIGALVGFSWATLHPLRDLLK